MPVVGWPDVCVDGTQVIGDFDLSAPKVWFDGVARTASEGPWFLRAASNAGRQVAIYKGQNSDVAYLMNDLGTEVALSATFGNMCVGIRSVSGGVEAVWVESQTIYKSRRYTTALVALEAVQSHNVPDALVGHMATGFLDLDASGTPLWTDVYRAITVKGIPLLYAVSRGGYYIGQLGGGYADQIVAVHATTGARGTLYTGLGFEPHAALANDGSGTVYVAFRTLGVIGATFVTFPPLPGFTGGISPQADASGAALSSLGAPIPLNHPVVEVQTQLRMTRAWSAWARAIDVAVRTPINLGSDVIGILPVSNMGIGDASSGSVLLGDGTWGDDPGNASPSDTVADLDGTGAAGASLAYSRGDHKHADTNRPTDDEKAALVGSAGPPDALNPYVTDDDARLTDARTPTDHAPTHEVGGGDEVDITALAGYPGGGTTFLRDDGTFADPFTSGGATSKRSFGWTFDGAGAVLTVGAKTGAAWRAPTPGTITKITLLADQAGSVVIDIWKDTLANYPPTNADSITASAPPTLSSDTDAEDATLTGWTTAFAAGDVFIPNIDSVTTLTRVTLLVEYLPS